MEEELFRIGVITSTHGLKGEVKVFPTTDDVKRFEYLKKCILRTKNGNIEVEKNTCKYFKNMVILSFKEFDNINQVEGFKQVDICVTRENLAPLEEDEYYIDDIIGADVFTEDGTRIGELNDVMFTGANDVYQVITEDERELLIPVVKDIVIEVDTENKKVVIRPIKGMI